MRIMTSNIWGDFFNNPTVLREPQIYGIYKKYNPDIIGFQEAAGGWYDTELFNKLGEEYRIIGTECCNNTNSTPIAIKKEYRILAYGNEQFSRLPDNSKSITWAVLERDGKSFAVCNTHFWWMRGNEPDDVKQWCGVSDYTPDDHNELRTENGRQLVRLMQYLQAKCQGSVFAFGDMNSVVSERVFDVYSENGVELLYNIAVKKDTACSIHGDPVRGDDGLFHGKRADAEYIKYHRDCLLLPYSPELEGYYSSIDHIIALGNGYMVQAYRVVEEQDALDATDHSPVFADITLL